MFPPSFPGNLLKLTFFLTVHEAESEEGWVVSGVHGYFDLVLCFSFYCIPFSLQITEVLFLKVCTLFNYEDKEMDDTNLVIHIVPHEFTIARHSDSETAADRHEHGGWKWSLHP